MADITGYVQGGAQDSQKVNWRGDQNAVPIAQSVYLSSSVQLAELGQRLVVGDRVFRYAQVGGVAAVPGDIMQQPGSLCSIPTTGGGTSPAGGKQFIFFHTASGAAADLYAEGSLHCVSGTSGNMGQIYRVKTHQLIATDTAGTITLYDSLISTENITDKWQLSKNPYKGVTQNTAGTAPSAGVLVCLATTNDYVWLQTWGPCAVKSSTAAGGNSPMYAAATGAAVGFIATGTGGTVFAQIGMFSTIPVASDRALGFLTIAP